MALQKRAQAVTLYQATCKGRLDEINREAPQRRGRFYRGVFLAVAGAGFSFAPLFTDGLPNASVTSWGGAFIALLGLLETGLGLIGRRNEYYRKLDLEIDMEQCRQDLMRCTAALEHLQPQAVLNSR